MRKVYAIFLLVSIFLGFIPQNVSAKDMVPSVSADSAVLMDATTGKILYSKNPDSAYPPASTTKTMTALLTLENTKLDDIVTVGKNPPLVDGSKIFLFEGEKLTVKDLLYSLFLVSANDSAEALAEYVGGSMDNFVKMMNERAKQLGCTDTNFVNPTGLYNDNHKTSARDLALIMRELSKHPEFKEIATTLSYKIAPTNKQNKERPLYNENKLVQTNTKLYYNGIDGGKTGYTIQSEHSYVASATRNGQKLIVALVHDKNTTYFYDAINLLNYGFDNFELVKLYSKGEKVSNYMENNLNIPLYAADDFYYIKDKSDSNSPALNIVPKDLTKLSFKSGDKILDASITFKNNNIGTLNLLSGSNHLLTSPNLMVSTTFNRPKVLVLLVVLVSLVSAIAVLLIRRAKLK